MLAFAADIHGEWRRLYENLPQEVEAVFICGDAEMVRSEEDLALIPAPKKHLKLGDFHFFWERGEVPVPTYVLLGNHEPYLWLWEYEKNGPTEVIKNLWVLARSGVIELCGLKIAYLGRVFAHNTYFEGRAWDPEKDKRSKKSKLAGRFTPEDVERLISEAAKVEDVDVLALHENPNCCKDARGREVYRDIVELVRPKLIICGHMHRLLLETFSGVPIFGLPYGIPVTWQKIECSVENTNL